VPKPTQDEIDTTVKFLEYVVADMEEHEPHALKAIELLKEVIQQMPSAGELN